MYVFIEQIPLLVKCFQTVEFSIQGKAKGINPAWYLTAKIFSVLTFVRPTSTYCENVNKKY